MPTVSKTCLASEAHLGIEYTVVLNISLALIVHIQKDIKLPTKSDTPCLLPIELMLTPLPNTFEKDKSVYSEIIANSSVACCKGAQTADS